MERTHTVLAVILALSLVIPVLAAAESAVGWLDQAADSRRSLREREYAARQILMLADSSASILLAALRGDDGDSGLRRQVAAGLLGEMNAPGAEDALLAAAFDRDYFLSEAARAALAKVYSRFGDGELYTMLKRGEPSRARLPNDGAEDGDDWVALSLRTARTRGRIRALAMHGLVLKYADTKSPPPANLADCVWEGLLDADPELRRFSVRAATKTGDSQAAEKIAAFLYTENDPKLLAEALRAMAEMRPPDYREAVERHTSHADPMVVLEALAALGAMGHAGALFPYAPGVRAVATFVSHPSTPVRRRAIAILVESKNSEALPPLQTALFDRVPANRAAAARALGELGFTGAVGALHPLLGDGRPEVRAEAAVALAKLGVIGVTQTVLGDLAGDSPPFRRAAAGALGRMGDSNAAPALAGVLDDDDIELACAAADALGMLRARGETKTMYTVMTNTPHPVLADAIRNTLAVLFDDDPGTTAASWRSWGGRHGF